MPSTPNYFLIGPVPQGGSFVYSGQLVDESGNGIPAANLTALTLTLVDLSTGTPINSRTQQNVLNANGMTVDSLGNLAWSATAADNPIVQTNPVLADGRVEVHQATIEWSWNSGAGVRQNKRKILIEVEVYTQVPA